MGSRKIIKKKKIVIRADATNEIGTGHIYRGMNIASKITEHEVVFLMDCKCKLGIEIVGKIIILYILLKIIYWIQ